MTSISYRSLEPMEWKSRLVGDKGKDHEKALDIETKVAKAYRLQSTPGVLTATPHHTGDHKGVILVLICHK